MRIIAGRLRRRQFKAPKGDATRPTTDRVRESLFNLLESRMSFDGVRVLDLFGGTGSLSFEAISRGAARATIVEDNGRVVRVAQKNAETLGIAAECHFVRADAVAFIERYAGPAWPLVFADPPYELPALPRLPDLVLAHLTPDGFFALEHDRRHDFADHPACLLTRPYGRTTVSLFGGTDRNA